MAVPSTGGDVAAENVVSSSSAAATSPSKKRKEKEELTKVVLRRLPPGLGRDELWAQLQPLPSDPHSFWFCAADPELAKQHCSFARAYLVFRDEKDAFSFAERFNGYVFVDKQGNESMAIVECALNQTIPKHLDEQAKKCDEKVDTLTSELSFVNFLKRYEAEAKEGPKRVMDFDELVKQIEEKKRQLEEGQVQETPLTAHIVRQMLEKGRKKSQRASMDIQEKGRRVIIKDRSVELELEPEPMNSRKKRSELRRQQRAEARKKAMDGAKVTAADGPAPERKPLMTPEERRKRREERKQARLVAKGMTKQQAQQPQGAAETTSTTAESSTVATTKKILTITTPKERITITRRRNSAAGSANEPNNNNNKNGGEDKNGAKSSKAEARKGATEGGGTGSSSTKRNKDRPEREIYRPGQRARQQRKSADGEDLPAGEKK